MNTTITIKESKEDWEGMTSTDIFSQYGKLTPKKLKINIPQLEELLGRNYLTDMIFSNEEIVKILNFERINDRRIEEKMKVEFELSKGICHDCGYIMCECDE